MTSTNALLIDSFTRVHDELPGLLRGLDSRALLWRPDADANPIGWLAWHLTRVQDDHLAGVGDLPQVYTADGFAALFALPYPDSAHGYGQSSAEVGEFRVDGPDLLIDYHEAVHAQTIAIVAGLDADDLDRIVDRRWTPPVTAAVRLVSVVNDITQHLGQIAYIKGLSARPRG